VEWVIAGALAAFAALLALVRANRTAAFDVAMTLRLQGIVRPRLRRLMQAVSWPGFPPQSRLIPPLIVCGWLAAGHRHEARLQAAGWATAAISTVIKAATRRPRPLPPQVRVAIAPLGGTSFPSGHVLTYIGVYGTFAYLVATRLDHAAVRAGIVVPLLVLLALVGPSRIEQGHHWATDVGASYLVGAAWLAALVDLDRRVLDRAVGHGPTNREPVSA
jgi:undecaprenyl-diphosphatase